MKLTPITYQIVDGTVLRIIIDDVAIIATLAKKPINYQITQIRLLDALSMRIIVGDYVIYRSQLAHKIHMARMGRERRVSVSPTTIDWF